MALTYLHVAVLIVTCNTSSWLLLALAQLAYQNSCTPHLGPSRGGRAGQRELLNYEKFNKRMLRHK